MGNERPLRDIRKYELDGFAYFEHRLFYYGPSEKYIFINRLYLASSSVTTRTSFINHTCIDLPLSLPEQVRTKFVALHELRNFLTVRTHGSLLEALLAQAKGFDEINIIFEYICRHKEFDVPTINSIIKLSVARAKIRKAFRAQDIMPRLILENFDLIDPALILEYLSRFPYPNNSKLLGPGNKYEKSIQAIEQFLKDKGIVSPEGAVLAKNSPFSLVARCNWNTEQDAGEEELRKWDHEGPGWRVANDMD